MPSDSREEILETAFSLLVNGCYEKITVDQIANEAGVSKGTVLYHFDSKLQLAIEVLSKFVIEERNEFLTRLERIEDAEERIKEFIDYNINLIENRPKYMRFFIEMVEKMVKEEMNPQRFFRDSKAKSRRIMKEALRECGINNPSERYTMLRSCLDGLTTRFVMRNGTNLESDLGRLKEEIFKTFVLNPSD